MNAERCACCGKEARKRTKENKGEEGKESERKNWKSGEKRLRYPQSPEVQSHSVPSHPIPSHPIPSHPILSHPILSFRCPRVCHAVRLNAKGPTEREQSNRTHRKGKDPKAAASRWQNEKSARIYRAGLRRRRRRRPLRRRRRRRRRLRRRRWDTHIKPRIPCVPAA